MNVYIPARNHLGDESRQVLVHLLKALNNIQMLVNKFFIKLPLSESLSAPQDIVRTLLNEELDPVHLEILMKDFLYPFMLKCRVDTDALLLEEMKVRNNNTKSIQGTLVRNISRMDRLKNFFERIPKNGFLGNICATI